ncbi:DUF2157 domain-containing protein [Sandaracinobacter sp. RS1-74]|uniref:DUF2157 domain-containing protein n=1 Tax=Sandaracinobacteroides sayramensis TaxID=2913411 RepID=UPI001EDC7BF5|nr:DUF2157 domain-containing protein [Sandaracinobacteroides sayramensis]MCG2840592.1 DUF2157 domain-containing protein [Sandaracinobacteroides sayramensis]
MSLERRLESWVEAGLIDRPTADRILAHESADRRPVALWAMAGLGLLALLLGILLLVSANWDRIPDWLKLSAHMLALAAVAAGHLWARGQGRRKLAEGLLFAFAGLALAGIALQAQVYQLTGHIWHALILWLAIAGPALLLGGTTRLTGILFAAMALLGPAIMGAETVDDRGLWWLAQGAAMAVPALLLLLSMRPLGNGPGFRMALREAGLVAILAGASIAHFAWASNITASQAADNALRLILPAGASLAALWLGRQPASDFPRPLLLPILIGPVAAFALALAVPHPDGIASRLVGLLAFVGMWGWVAQGAARTGLNSLFAVAIAAIAIRIFIIYIELFGSLAATGGGLVLGGLLLVGLSYLWHRIVSKRKADA